MWCKYIATSLVNSTKIGLVLILMLSLVACSSDQNPRLNPTKMTLEEQHRGLSPIKGGIYLEPAQNQRVSKPLSREKEQFVKQMVNKHGFNHSQLRFILSQTEQLDSVIRLMDKQAPKTASTDAPNGAWIRYKNRVITQKNLTKGVEFWNRYKADLERAHQIYGVPPEIIVGIIGVETRWGGVMGNTPTIDALTTLSFAYPRRADYFIKELEDYLLMTRDEGIDPFALTGSFAGAMGYGQFMPSAFRRYAVDFNQDGHVDLWDPVDAIGSIANYFSAQGWQQGRTVAIMADGEAPQLDHGFKSKYSVTKLKQAGLKPQKSVDGYREVSLLKLDMGDRYQYWYGLPNFYVITRYNHSTHYAMAVWQLGQAVKAVR
ncbi:lytic murein transglycosylase B [Orbaceae bacterium ESL0721]|nr:lytic murein transglycosylase B [Orbaceae bacterium ESL0721]